MTPPFSVRMSIEFTLLESQNENVYYFRMKQFKFFGSSPHKKKPLAAAKGFYSKSFSSSLIFLTASSADVLTSFPPIPTSSNNVLTASLTTG